MGHLLKVVSNPNFRSIYYNMARTKITGKMYAFNSLQLLTKPACGRFRFLAKVYKY